MALSYCSNFGPLINSQQDYLTEDELLCFNGSFNCFSSDYLINPLLEFDESLFCSSQFPSFSSPQYNLFDNYADNPNAVQIPAELPKFEAPAGGFFEGRSEEKQNGQGRSLSAQSIAARERRRKITDKTRELGKLVPGGNKMNTAEMLRSAYSYVKFLQAQLHLLQLMRECQNPDRFDTNEFQVLVASPKIQEKLYSEEKCLVPTEFLGGIPSYDEIQ